MGRPGIRKITRYSDDFKVSAVRLSELPEVSGIETQYWVLVRKSLAHRARWVTAQLPPTEEELSFLATGKLPEQE